MTPLGTGQVTVDIHRRKFISAVGVAAVAWPLATRAQQPAMPVIGFLRDTSLADAGRLVAGFARGLKEEGFIEGQNVAIEYHSAEGRADQLPVLVADLVRRQVALIVGNTPSTLAAKAATATVPIVFVVGTDPVKLGLVNSINRPGGNATGVSFLSAASATKRLELLSQFAPKVDTIAVLLNRNTPEAAIEQKDVQAVANAAGQHLIIAEADSDSDIEAAFATFVERKAGALFVGNGAFLRFRRERVVALAARQVLPAVYPLPEYTTAGGLMSYGANQVDAYRLAGTYAGHILKGEKPADLPVQQSTKFDLVINLKTAKALGLETPAKLLALADEVIE
jgi:putative ABC transport system substrate-binding protein